MKSQRRSLAVQDIPLASCDKVLKVTVSYDMGGMNFFTGSESARGYYLSTRVVTLTAGLEIYGLLSGYKTLIEPSSRFSATRLDALATAATASPRLPSMVSSTLKQAGESLAP